MHICTWRKFHNLIHVYLPFWYSIGHCSQSLDIYISTNPSHPNLFPLAVCRYALNSVDFSWNCSAAHEEETPTIVRIEMAALGWPEIRKFLSQIKFIVVVENGKGGQEHLEMEFQCHYDVKRWELFLFCEWISYIRSCEIISLPLHSLRERASFADSRKQWLWEN